MLSASVSIVLPARNEAAGLALLLPRLKDLSNVEVVVVDDGSTDQTAELCRQHGVEVVRHPYSRGNGAAIKSGIRRARGDVLVFMDADGQHDVADIPRLLEAVGQGYDMVVGARDAGSQASFGRRMANGLYNRLSSWMVGHRIADLTSGFRAVRSHLAREFLHLLPNGFSYPTTLTMAFFRAGYSVAYLPIRAARREGKSHISPMRDSVRFLIIIFKVGTLYSPLKLFLPISLFFFFSGVGYYVYTFLTQHRFTNMSILLFVTSVLVFLMGLVSEQITLLNYKREGG